MKLKIGFNAEMLEERKREPAAGFSGRCAAPVRSVARVFFPERGATLAYYNDMFDLRRGDIVYVDGKLEGLRGRVVDVLLSFKIKPSDYQRVTGLADTGVSGELFIAGSHFVTFDPSVLPFEKAVTWFKAPAEEEYVIGSGESAFRLDDLSGMKADAGTAQRGSDYYMENKAAYVSVDGTRGRAVVEGSRAYELEFEYRGGEISGLVCGCRCAGVCKHQVAAMLQLRETLELAEKYYPGSFAASGCLAAVSKTALFTFVIDGRESGGIII